MKVTIFVYFRLGVRVFYAIFGFGETVKNQITNENLVKYYDKLNLSTSVDLWDTAITTAVHLNLALELPPLRFFQPKFIALFQCGDNRLCVC
jgi:hypothetical protein